VPPPPLQDEGMVPSVPYYWQPLWYNLAMLATWGADVRLAMIDPVRGGRGVGGGGVCVSGGHGLVGTSVAALYNLVQFTASCGMHGTHLSAV
jgi:hypothetical protein